MSSAGDITTESESLPSCSHISSSDDEVCNNLYTKKFFISRKHNEFRF